MKHANPKRNRSVQLRPGRSLDVPAIAALEAASFARSPERFHHRQIRYLVTQARSVILVAESEGRLLGWAAGLLRQHVPGRKQSGSAQRKALSGRVYAIVVATEARGMRIGQRLLEQLLVELERRGVRKITLEVRSDNEPAITLYRKFGFGHDRHLQHYYGRGIHGLHMTRVL